MAHDEDGPSHRNLGGLHMFANLRVPKCYNPGCRDFPQKPPKILGPSPLALQMPPPDQNTGKWKSGGELAG